jgi:hypothetical protein
MYIFFFCEGHLRSCGAAQARQEEKIFPLLLILLHYFLHIKQRTVIKNKQEDDEKDKNAAFLRKKTSDGAKHWAFLTQQGVDCVIRFFQQTSHNIFFTHIKHVKNVPRSPWNAARTKKRQI